MKTLLLLTILFSILEKINPSEKNYSIPLISYKTPVSETVSRIILDFYSIESKQLVITRVVEKHKNDVMINDIIDGILFRTRDRILIRLEEHEAKRSDYTRFHNVFFIDSYKSFRKIIDGKATDTFDFTGYYTIVLINIERNYHEIVKRILQDCWELYIVNVNVVTYDPYNMKRAFIHTYFPYTPEHCGEVVPVIYGVYENESFMEEITIFPDKVSNLYGCSLSIGTFNFPPYMILIPEGEERYKYSGFEGILVTILAQRLNFSLIYKTSEEMWGKLEGENSTGICGMLLRGEVNFSVGAFGFSAQHQLFVSNTLFYHTSPLVLLIPPGKPHTSIGRLFKPFSISLWSCLLATFFLTTIAVLFGKFLSIQKRAFLFGPRNRYPLINTVNLFFGGALETAPKRNFARFQLMLWIILSLLLRGSYQGAMYGFLKKQDTISVDTLQKMLEAGFKIYGDEDLATYFTTMPDYGTMFSLINVSQMEEYRLKTTEG